MHKFQWRFSNLYLEWNVCVSHNLNKILCVKKNIQISSGVAGGCGTWGKKQKRHPLNPGREGARSENGIHNSLSPKQSFLSEEKKINNPYFVHPRHGT